jgi:uncharacterized membrane protein YqaE (UPF0057 family)
LIHLQHGERPFAPNVYFLSFLLPPSTRLDTAGPISDKFVVDIVATSMIHAIYFGYYSKIESTYFFNP